MVAPATVPGILQYGTHAARPSATTTAVGAIYFCSTHGLVYQSDGATWTTVFGAQAGVTTALGFVIDGGGSTITTGMKGGIEVPFAATIIAARLFADQSGSIVVDIWKTTYSAYDPTTHPATGDKITASAPPTISSAKKAQDSTLTGWTTAVTAGDFLAFNVNSVTTIQRVSVALTLVRT
jgi:hypothetical protein